MILCKLNTQVKLFGFLISRKGEQEGKAIPAISTVANFAGQ
jgi:hypothetical protein